MTFEEGMFNMPEMKMTFKLPGRKSIRSKMIKRRRTIKDGSINQDEKFGEHAIVDQTLAVQKRGRVGSPRINTGRKVVTGKARNTRTGPAGKKAMISDEAVDSISENMEKRTKKAIAEIGRSIGF